MVLSPTSLPSERYENEFNSETDRAAGPAVNAAAPVASKAVSPAESFMVKFELG
jgi:hypothetical protein